MAGLTEGGAVETGEAVSIAGLAGEESGIVVGCAGTCCVAIGEGAIEVDGGGDVAIGVTGEAGCVTGWITCLAG